MTRTDGDCYARFEVLLDQVQVSLDLAEACVDRLRVADRGPGQRPAAQDPQGARGANLRLDREPARHQRLLPGLARREDAVAAEAAHARRSTTSRCCPRCCRAAWSPTWSRSSARCSSWSATSTSDGQSLGGAAAGRWALRAASGRATAAAPIGVASVCTPAVRFAAKAPPQATSSPGLLSSRCWAVTVALGRSTAVTTPRTAARADCAATAASQLRRGDARPEVEHVEPQPPDGGREGERAEELVQAAGGKAHHDGGASRPAACRLEGGGEPASDRMGGDVFPGDVDLAAAALPERHQARARPRVHDVLEGADRESAVDALLDPCGVHPRGGGQRSEPV